MDGSNCLLRSSRVALGRSSRAPETGQDGGADTHSLTRHGRYLGQVHQRPAFREPHDG